MFVTGISWFGESLLSGCIREALPSVPARPCSGHDGRGCMTCRSRLYVAFLSTMYPGVAMSCIGGGGVIAHPGTCLPLSAGVFDGTPFIGHVSGNPCNR